MVMKRSDQPHEIRDPIHGFIGFNRLERSIIAHRYFQRLRRIRQLGWTEYVYPSAKHSRFEHSLGAMHVASRLFDAICADDRSLAILEGEYGASSSDLKLARQVIRLAALLHDIGHPPFSHSSDRLLPERKGGGRYGHEDYSCAAILETDIKDIIEAVLPKGTATRVASLIVGRPRHDLDIVLDGLIDGIMDGDRLDYLQRDSYHCGVKYGSFDIERIIGCICLCPDEKAFRLGIEKGGVEALEGVLIARYMMFANVYFHKTRLIAERHYQETAMELIKRGEIQLPAPSSSEQLDAYFELDDYRIWEKIQRIPTARIADRNHFRMVREIRLKTDLEEGQAAKKLADWATALRKEGIDAIEVIESTQLMKVPRYSIPVREGDGGKLGSLLECSWLAAALSTNIVGVGQLFVEESRREVAAKALASLA